LAKVTTHDEVWRHRHAAEGYGEFYNKLFEKGYYSALWSEVEKPIVESVLRPMGGRDRTCLDFACGTGRITNVAAEFFGKVVGTEISDTMLATARTPNNVCLRKIDLTVEPLGESFDVVTAFRFFLNADGSLRLEALKAIHAHLNTHGRLVCNIHLNAASPAGFARRIVNWIPNVDHRNTLSLHSFNTLLNEADFVATQVICYGFLPGLPFNLLANLSYKLVKPVEELALALRVPASLAQHFIVVARKK
jgi:SAM-dependent methyltransferase